MPLKLTDPRLKPSLLEGMSILDDLQLPFEMRGILSRLLQFLSKMLDLRSALADHPVNQQNKLQRQKSSTHALRERERSSLRQTDLSAMSHLFLLAASGLALGLLRLFGAAARVVLRAGSPKTISLLAGGGGIDSWAGPASTARAGVVEEPDGWISTSGADTITRPQDFNSKLTSWGANWWGQKRLSRYQRLKSNFLAKNFSIHSRQKFPSVSFKERRTL